MSFARKREMMEKNGHVTAVPFYEATHKRKDNSINEFSSHILEECQSRLVQMSSSTLPRSALEDEVMSEVQGPDYHGRVRGEGRGLTPSSMKIHKMYEAATESNEAELESQRAEIETLKKTMQEKDAVWGAQLKAMQQQLQLLIQAGFASL